MDNHWLALATEVDSGMNMWLNKNCKWSLRVIAGGKKICSVSFDLDFGGYEARALEETILQWFPEQGGNKEIGREKL